MFDNFVKTYSVSALRQNVSFKHTTMIRHKGTVIAFAIDSEQKIWYAILDGAASKAGSPLDVNYWPDEPTELIFPNEIAQVGYSAVGVQTIPEVYTDGERNAFLSSTGRLTADAPFQALSDGNHIFLFRQAIHVDWDGFPLQTEDLQMDTRTTDDTNVANAGRMVFVTDANGKLVKSTYTNPLCNVPIVNATLLIDRFILVGGELQRTPEVRFRRSRHKEKPESRKDNLDYTDMNDEPFYEPTQELNLVQNLDGGRFSILLLPTDIPNILRWQIFAYNKTTKMIDSFNIERSKEGLFNTKGTVFYTSPDPRYQKDVFEAAPGKCPFTGQDLRPIIAKEGYAESALHFDGKDGYVEIVELKHGSQVFTVEAWIKPQSLTSQRQFCLGTGGTNPLNVWLNAKGAFQFQIGMVQHETSPVVQAGRWTHLALVVDDQTIEAHVNGQLIQPVLAAGQSPTVLDSLYLGYSPGLKDGTAFNGDVDEIRLWGYRRTPDEIQTSMSYRLIGNEPALIGCWRFDEDAGNTVYDQTDYIHHGQIHGRVTWVNSDAPIGKHPGVQHSSFKIEGREFEHGLSALFYFLQEEQVNDDTGDAKPRKTNGRVMLAFASSGPDPFLTDDGSQPDTADAEKAYIGILDFGVSREGNLALVADTIALPPVKHSSILGRETLDEIITLQTQISRLQSEVRQLVIQHREKPITNFKFIKDTLEAEIINLKNVLNQIKPAEMERDWLTDVQYPLQLIHVDAFGLGTLGGLLSFAWTNDVPVLYDAADGDIALYFRGLSDQFFVTYYDTRCRRPLYQIAGLGEVVFCARQLAPFMDTFAITVGDSSNKNADHCDVEIALKPVDDKSQNLALVERWPNVPRDAKSFAQVLNGVLTTQDYDYFKVTIEQNRQIIARPYAQVTVEPNDQIACRPLTGSLLVYAVSAYGKVPNGVAGVSKDTTEKHCRWFGKSQGHTLLFADDTHTIDTPSPGDNTEIMDIYATNSHPEKFDVEGDITFEGWVKPHFIDGEAQIIVQHSEKSRYSLSLKHHDQPRSVMQFGGEQHVVVEIGNPIREEAARICDLEQQYTLQAWVKAESFVKRGRAELQYRWIICKGPQINLGIEPINNEGANLVFAFHPQADSDQNIAWRLQMGGTHFAYTKQNLLTGEEPFKFGQWQHVAVTKDGDALCIYVNGQPQALEVAFGDYQQARLPASPVPGPVI